MKYCIYWQAVYPLVERGGKLLLTFFLFKFLEYAVILIHTCLLRLLATQFLNKGFILTLEKHIYAQNKLRIRICCRVELFRATAVSPSFPKLERNIHLKTKVALKKLTQNGLNFQYCFWSLASSSWTASIQSQFSPSLEHFARRFCPQFGPTNLCLYFCYLQNELFGW